MKHKIGIRIENQEQIPKKWTMVDYLINNGVIKLSNKSEYRMRPFDSKKHVMLRYFLYTIIDLHAEGKKNFGFNQIVLKMNENQDKYDMRTMEKIKYDTEVIYSKKYHLNKQLPQLKKITKEQYVKENVSRALKKYSKNRNRIKDNIYCSIYLCLGNFLEVIYLQDSQNKIQKYYYLSQEGKKLAKKVLKENYVF